MSDQKYKMILKIHQKDGKSLVSVCDSNLIGKIFEDKEKRLDLTSDFYKGEEKTFEEIGDIMRNVNHVNLVGEKSIELGVKEGIIDKENILYVEGVPHAQAMIEK